jgi:large subunit ribosomal protein L6
MSRVAKADVLLPANVELSISNSEITVKGPKGALTKQYNNLVAIARSEEDSNRITFKPAKNDPNAWAQAGTVRSIVNNMVHGVSVGFERTLELVGVGYRANAKPGTITLSLGFSHTIDFAVPEGISVETPNNTTIILKGLDKQQLGQVASKIRSLRPPEPYKGKGVRYAGQVIELKEAKKK